MAFPVTDKGGDFEMPKPGLHSAVCSGVVNLGLQPGFEGTLAHKAAFLFELDQRYTTGEYSGKRMVQSKDYTASFNEKANLRKDIESWEGKSLAEFADKGFDIDQQVGKNCQLNLLLEKSKTGKEYMKIVAVLPANELAQPMTIETPGYIPEWIKKKITAPQQAAMGEQKEEKIHMSRVMFDAAIDKCQAKPSEEERNDTFDKALAWLNIHKAAGTCSFELYKECSFVWELATGRKNPALASHGFNDFDDSDIKL